MIVYKKNNGEVVSMEDNFIENEEYGCTELIPEAIFIKMFFNPISNQFFEGISEKEIEIYKDLKIIDLDIEYTQKINDLVYVHVQKLATRNIPIPRDILDKQQELINEFYKKKL